MYSKLPLYLRDVTPIHWDYDVTKKYFEVEDLNYFETISDEHLQMIKKVLGNYKTKITVQIEVIYIIINYFFYI